MADSLVINKNQISGRIAQSQTATRFAYAVAFCAVCTIEEDVPRGAWQPATSSSIPDLYICVYKVATPRQLLNEQHVLGLTRGIFIVLRRLPAPAGVFWLTLCASDCLVAVVVFRLLYCIGACRMEIENCS